ncbi:MAG TPA: sigma-70 family RNA polymerase sigma factor [Dongiaceae bacterium]|nr:sigma-70 family RNA polymerase sigma factor [Dongiaceae bacterium]
MMSTLDPTEHDLSDLESRASSVASVSSEDESLPIVADPVPDEPATSEEAPPPPPTFDGVELHLLEQLRAKDEQAFNAFVGTHHRAMVRFAMQFVRSRASAEEVTQDTWLAALDGLAQFEGRSSLISWIYAILINKAKSRGRRDSRDRAMTSADGDGWDGAAEDGGQIPQDLSSDGIDPERILAGREIGDIIQKLIGDLPELQRAVITMQDIQGHDSVTVCQALNLTDANRRVLLHRARGRLRRELQAILGEQKAAAPPGR